MAVPEEIRLRLSRWCAERIPEPEREHRRIGYTITGDDVTISDRRAPRFPELGAEWTSTPLARLHRNEATGGWTLLRASGDGGWRTDGTGDDPITLLEQVTGPTAETR